MGMPAARIGDMHVCPMVTPGVPPIPHVGGPIIGPCAPTVLIGSMPAARISDMCVCVGPPDVIVKGSSGVLIQGLPAARIGDNTAHGGVIVVGFPTVLIGETAGGGGGAGGAPGAGASNPSTDMSGVFTNASSLSSPGPQGQALRNAAQDGTPFCKRCAELAAKALRGG